MSESASMWAVFDNKDLMRIITFFIADEEKATRDEQFLIISPFFPLMMTFRSAWEVFDEVREQYEIEEKCFISLYKDFVCSESMILWAIEMGCNFSNAYGLYYYVSSTGNLDIIKWLDSQDEFRLDPMKQTNININRISIKAAYNGHLHLLEYFLNRSPRLPYDSKTYAAASDQNHENIVFFLRSFPSPFPWDHQTCAGAARNGNLPFLQRLRSSNPPCPWSAFCCTEAAKNGHFSTLQWLHSNGCPWDSNTFSAAAGPGFSGDFTMLEWLYNQTPRCPWDTRTCASAAEHGHLNVLIWLRNDDNKHQTISDWGEFSQCPWDEDTVYNAVKNGHIEVIEWVISRDPACPWEPMIAGQYAALHKQVDVLIWLEKNYQYPFNSITCSYAVQGGDPSVLEFLAKLKPPCPWDSRCCAVAAKFGKLKVLKLLRSQNPPCPYGSDACFEAVAAGNLHILKWLLRQKPPCAWNRDLCYENAKWLKDERMVGWISKQPKEVETWSTQVLNGLRNRFGM